MIRILVCHKNTERMELLCRIIRAFFQNIRYSYQLNGYRNHEAAVKYLKENTAKIDIVLIDCTEQTEAVDFIRKLRADDERVSWVYLDGELSGLLNMLILRPSGYLADSSNAGAVAAVLQKLTWYHRIMQKKYNFAFKCDGEYIRIPYEEISYFESSAKKVTLHLDKQTRTYDFVAKLDDIEAQLPDRFLRCHQSYLVNMRLIRKLDTKNHLFVMANNEEILISRRNYTYAKEEYQKFLSEQ